MLTLEVIIISIISIPYWIALRAPNFSIAAIYFLLAISLLLFTWPDTNWVSCNDFGSVMALPSSHDISLYWLAATCAGTVTTLATLVLRHWGAPYGLRVFIAFAGMFLIPIISIELRSATDRLHWATCRDYV